jgi:general stress protein YciG
MAEHANQSRDRAATGQFTGGAALRDTGRKGREVSSGNFQKGSERPREAVTKGAQTKLQLFWVSKF